MKRYFWMIAIVAFVGLFITSSANAHGGYRGGHGRHQAYRAGYHQGVRDARHRDNGWHGRYHGNRGYYAPRHHYPRHRYYAPRPVVRVSVPVPPPPRVIIRP